MSEAITTEWNGCNNVYELGQLLVKRGNFDSMLWRKFHCRCCRNVWGFIAERSRFVISQAERFVVNEISVSQLSRLHQEAVQESDAAWLRVSSLKLPSDRKDALWPLSDEVDDAWCSYLSAACARVVTKSQIDSYVIPDSASALVAWRTARSDVLRNQQHESRELVESRWKQIQDDEEKKQVIILREIISF